MVRRWSYVRTGEVKSLTHYFSVPKGEDIRMVYNRISSGLNSYIWATHFALPTVGSTIWAVKRGMIMSDRDIGEMFLNFMLSEEVRSFYGVDITNVRTEEEWEKHRSGGWEMWERKMMGLTESHYHTCQTLTWAKRIDM